MSEVSPFPTAQLADVVDILDNLRVPINGAERMGRAGAIPYYGANGFQGWIDRPIFNEPLILLAEDGGNFDDFATRPIAYRIDGPSWVNNHAHVIRAKAGVCQSFIFWSIVNKDIRKYIAGGTRTKLTQGELRRIEINVPSEHEQQGIAQILDTLDAAIHQTEAIIAKLKAVKQGLLHDLLTRGIDANGELRPPQAEAPHLYKESSLGWVPKEWEVDVIAKVLESIDAGKSPSCQDIPALSGEWGVLKVSAVHPNGFRSNQNKVVSNPVFIVPEYEVKADDLLITRANTPELVGYVCLVKNPQPQLMLCDKTLRLNVKLSVATKLYLFIVLQQPRIRAQIEVAATGTSMSMKNISQTSIQNLQIPIPPLLEQAKIGLRVEKIEQELEAENEQFAKLLLLKSGLMDDLLTGRVRVTPLLAEAAQQGGA